MLNKEENSGNDVRNAEILIAVLESGMRVALPATGFKRFIETSEKRDYKINNQQTANYII